MRTSRSIVGVIAGVGLLVGIVALERERVEAPMLEVVFGQDDGLPETLTSGRTYEATFSIQWDGPVELRDGLVFVYLSRRGDEPATESNEPWPLACVSEVDNVIGVASVRCDFEAPGPGEFALLLEVRSDDGELVGEGLYSHEAVA